MRQVAGVACMTAGSRRSISAASPWPSDVASVGATITVRIGEQMQSRLVQSGDSYLSQGDMRQHFGLGSATTVDSIEVSWPDGSVTRKTGVAANQIFEIRQE